jgi:hypothetical protein
MYKCMYIQYIQGPLSVQAPYTKSYPIINCSCYNGSLFTWTVVCLTAAKFKSLIFQTEFRCYPYYITPWVRPAENTVSNSSSIVACVSVAAGSCLPNRSLAAAVYSGSTILTLRWHITILYISLYNLLWFYILNVSVTKRAWCLCWALTIHYTPSVVLTKVGWLRSQLRSESRNENDTCWIWVFQSGGYE